MRMEVGDPFTWAQQQVPIMNSNKHAHTYTWALIYTRKSCNCWRHIRFSSYSFWTRMLCECVNVSDCVCESGGPWQEIDSGLFGWGTLSISGAMRWSIRHGVAKKFIIPALEGPEQSSGPVCQGGHYLRRWLLSCLHQWYREHLNVSQIWPRKLLGHWARSHV